jgi:hypothetical protein
MFYVQSDVLRLVQQIPWSRFMKPESALRFWARLRDDGIELAHILRQFPAVKYQPLDTLYACARAVAALDEKLVADLSRHYSWQGVVQASFLAALRPDAAYAVHLQQARAHVPRNQWIVDLALDEIQDATCDRYPEHQKALRALRELVAGLPQPPAHPRPGPTADESMQLKIAAAEIADAYRVGGASHARAALEASAWKNFL